MGAEGIGVIGDFSSMEPAATAAHTEVWVTLISYSHTPCPRHAEGVTPVKVCYPVYFRMEHIRTDVNVGAIHELPPGGRFMNRPYGEGFQEFQEVDKWRVGYR